MLLSINLTYAQIKNITGIIIDEESREPLTGASVTVKGSRQGCISDLDGKFSLQPTLPGQQMLVISYIGYQTIEVPARHNMMEIRLRPNVNELDEVVVQVAYGTVLKRSITGAVSVVDSSKSKCVRSVLLSPCSTEQYRGYSQLTEWGSLVSKRKSGSGDTVR